MNAEFDAKVNEFFQLNEEIKEKSKKANALKAELKEIVLDSGTKDPKGSLEISTTDGKFRATQTLRVSTGLKTDALEVIKKEGSRADRRDLIETIEIVREDVLEEKIENGTIDVELAQRLINVKENYAFSVKAL